MPGEIADMMLDGTLCEGCGEYLGGAGDGFPRYCSDECAAGRGVDLTCNAAAPPKITKHQRRRQSMARDEPCACPMCGKHKSGDALVAHMRDAHRKRMTIEPITPQEKSNGN